MSTLLILNAKLVQENREIQADVYIRGGRIEKIARDLSSMKVSKVLDLKGKHLLPGMIDSHVQFPDDYLQNDCEGKGLDKGKGDIHSESRAAVAGGVTTFFSASNDHYLNTTIVTNKILKEKMALASEKSLANYSFYHSATNKNLDELKLIKPTLCCGLKIAMSGTRGELLVDDISVLNSIFESSPLLIAAHCENTPIIVENEESYRQIHGDNIPMELHPKVRSEEACYSASSLMVELAKAHDARLHLLHISTAKEVELLSNDPSKDKLITAEVAAHYLDFTVADYAKKGALIKCNPAIKTEIDRAGLFQGLMDGRLDCISSNHILLTKDEKQGNYFDVYSGVPTSQCTLLSLLEHYHDGILSLQNLIDKTSHSVADVFKMKDRGYIREGYWADLVAVDFDKDFTPGKEDIISKAGWSPYEGNTFRSSIHATIVNGNLVYINNKVRSGENGKRVEFDR